MADPRRLLGLRLALAYAQTHPERVSALVLRGVFTGRRCEVAWLVGGGAARLFPGPLGAPCGARPGRTPRGRPRRLSRAAGVARSRGAPRGRETVVPMGTGDFPLSPVGPAGSDAADEDADLALAEIGMHYFAHGCFLRDGQLLADAGRLAGIPGILVQGRYDAVTPPPRTAFDLHRAWPGSDLVIVSDAGHASSEPGLSHHLVAATDRLAEPTMRSSGGRRSRRRSPRMPALWRARRRSPPTGLRTRPAVAEPRDAVHACPGPAAVRAEPATAPGFFSDQPCGSRKGRHHRMTRTGSFAVGNPT